MKKGIRITLAFLVLTLCGSLIGCTYFRTTISEDTGESQLANPWVEVTNEEAATLLGGKMYDLTTLDRSYEKYVLMVTTQEAMENYDINPTAWARYRKGNEDISLQIQNGGTLDAEQLKGTPVKVNGIDAYIISSGDGTSQIVWESEGLLMEISTSTVWEDAALGELAQGVKAID